MEETQHNRIDSSATVAGMIRGETATGDLRIHPFRSRIYGNDRFLRVWLPPAYDDAQNAARQFPVLYLNDGQNLFEPATSFNGIEWQVDETADRLIREQVIPPLIIVRIDNAGKDRVREYMPHRSFQPDDAARSGDPIFQFSDEGGHAFRGAPLSSGIRSSEHWLGRVFVRSIDRLIYRRGFTRDLWPNAVGESIVVGGELPDYPPESHSPALAGTRLPRDWKRGGVTGGSRP